MKGFWLAGLQMAAALLPPALQAAEGTSFAISGSVRLRHELLDGQFRPGFDEQDGHTNLRSSLLAQWRKGDWRLVGEISDGRAYGINEGSVLTANDVNSFEPVQAFVQRDFRAPFGEGSSALVQAGRFTLNLGSRRLLASDEYRNTPQGNTGLRAELRTAGKAVVNVFYLLPQQRRPDDFAALRNNDWKLDHEGTDLQLHGVLASQAGLLPGGTLGEVGYIRLREQDNGMRATRNRQLHSFSMRALRDPAAGRLDVDVEGVYQTGRISASAAPAAAALDVRAWFVHAEAGYSWTRAWEPHLSLEFDHASGDGPGADYTRFDTLFGMRRADLAPSGIFSAIGRTNVQALGLRLELAPSARLDLMMALRMLRAAEASDSFSTTGIRDASGAAGRNAGQLLDLRLRYWLLAQKLRAEVNVVWLKRGQMLRDAPNASPWGNTHYGSAAVTYTF